MPPSHHERLAHLRRHFLPPTADAAARAEFVAAVAQALERIDALKADAPRLRATTAEDSDSAVRRLVRCFDGLPLWSHPAVQANMNAQPTTAALIGTLLTSALSPNLCSAASSRGVGAAEARVATLTAELVGYDPAAARGVFTFGGTGSMLYGLKLGLEKALPGAMRRGVDRPVVVLASEASHHAVLNAAAWLGIGDDAVVRVATQADDSIRLDALHDAARRVLKEGRRPAALVATVGTTDAFGLDDVEGMAAVRDALVVEFDLPYRPHLHADAVSGWAWSTFNDYDFAENPLQFRSRTVTALQTAQRRVRGLAAADSLGVDFHKTGFAPAVSSLFLVRRGGDFDLLARDRRAMSYLDPTGDAAPGLFTLETTRSGGGPIAALASLLALGRDGLQVLIAHAVDMSQLLRETLEGMPEVVVLNDANGGPATLFRLYPPGVDARKFIDRERRDPALAAQVEAVNRLNRRVCERCDALVGLCDGRYRTDFGAPLTALKSYVSSPFTDASHMQSLVETVVAARDAIRKEDDGQA